ncbi:MAG TPA: hypothetical protein PKI49_08315 [Pseudomonadota bacterium]|nr:hypothetical protein [Pseudomonadota bacterium]HND11102.1 hypothetical protein [Pseudomonadota bacterium]HNK46687.1 hypothetical protein [Pseudomonadota bacterium]HNN50968.1 hypothetical protein [Pseudomonadota bacterium]HNO68501.1 hypothetical protein [Pseudomonadota bacterium]
MSWGSFGRPAGRTTIGRPDSGPDGRTLLDLQKLLGPQSGQVRTTPRSQGRLAATCTKGKTGAGSHGPSGDGKVDQVTEDGPRRD